MRAASLCAGYGGLDLGLQIAGVDVDLAWYAEIDKHASQVMAAHHPDVPNRGDLTQIEDCEPVDVLTAGFPCQPVSTAGKRKGIHDGRWLIDDVVRVACRADARWLVLENVSGILTANDGQAFFQVVRALAEGGFVAEWVCVRASDVGAPHQRLRWFCVGYADGPATPSALTVDGQPRPLGEPRAVQRTVRPDGSPSGAAASDADESSGEARGDSRHESERFRTQPVGPAAPAADADGDGHGQGPHTRGMGRVDSEDAGAAQQRERSRQVVGDQGGEAAADADVSGRSKQRRPVSMGTEQQTAERGGSRVDWGPYTDAIRRWEPVVGRPAPNPTDDQRRLNPRFVEWMMGLPDGWVCDAVEGRSHQLRILGNGVVPQQAAYAISVLNDRISEQEAS